jgi:hypothetical protein
MVSSTGEFSPNPCMKNMISTYRKDFHEKKLAQISQIFKNKILPIARFLLLVPLDSPKYRKI